MKRHLILLAIFLTVYSVNADFEWKFESCDIPAPSLANNLVGDATIQTIGVILPPSYATSDQRYPVIYSLHGWGDGVGRDWYLDMLDSDWQQGQDSEFIWVHLSGVNALHGSFYTNSPVTGNWGDFVADDVVAYVDSHYRTLDTPGNRAITGHSMGGAGCLELAMTRPDVFSIAYAMSPGLMRPDDVHHWHVAEPDLLSKMESIITEIRNEETTENAIPILLNRLAQEDDWRAYFTFGYGIAYAGDPQKPFPFFDYEVDTKYGQKVMSSETLQVYREGFGNLEAKLKLHSKALSQLKLFAIDCGYHDNFPWIYRGTRYFSNLLEERQISHLLILHQGDHGSMLQHQLMHSMIPLVTENFDY